MMHDLAKDFRLIMQYLSKYRKIKFWLSSMDVRYTILCYELCIFDVFRELTKEQARWSRAIYAFDIDFSWALFNRDVFLDVLIVRGLSRTRACKSTVQVCGKRDSSYTESLEIISRTTLEIEMINAISIGLLFTSLIGDTIFFVWRSKQNSNHVIHNRQMKCSWEWSIFDVIHIITTIVEYTTEARHITWAIS